MSEVHAIGAIVVLVATAVFFVFALVVARSGRALGAVGPTRKMLAAVVGAEVLLGLVLLAQGARPRENLHFLYGAVALAAVPLARTFAAEAPPKAQAGALAAGAGLMLVMVWRLWVTGGA